MLAANVSNFFPFKIGDREFPRVAVVPHHHLVAGRGHRRGRYRREGASAGVRPEGHAMFPPDHPKSLSDPCVRSSGRSKIGKFGRWVG